MVLKIGQKRCANNEFRNSGLFTIPLKRKSHQMSGSSGVPLRQAALAGGDLSMELCHLVRENGLS